MKIIRPFCYLLFIPTLSLAEVVTDGSLGPAQTLQGPNYQVTESLGQREGANLFHSFDSFSINQNESVTFTGSDDIANVISRVTGGMSVIDGLLTSTIGNANFFLINPAGVVFGQNAQINVPAAFHVSTAKQLNFSDGSQFITDNPNSSSLSMASPESFGFTNDLTGSISLSGTTIKLQSKETLSLSGQDLTIDDSTISFDNGQVHLNAVGQQNVEVPISDLITDTLSGSINMTNSTISVTGDGIGKIEVQAGDFMALNSLFKNHNFGSSVPTGYSQFKVNNLTFDNTRLEHTSFDGGAGDIVINVIDTLTLNNGGSIKSDTLFNQDAGSITVYSGDIKIDGSGDVDGTTGIKSTASLEVGNAGHLKVMTSGSIDLIEGGFIKTSSFSNGNAGDITISAQHLTLTHQNADTSTEISTSASATSNGNSGFIKIDLTGNLNIFGGEIKSTSFSAFLGGGGGSGDINIESQNLIIDGIRNPGLTGISSEVITGVVDNNNQVGESGDITLKILNNLSILNEGNISSSSGTFSNSDGGDIKIISGNILIDNGNGSEYITGINSSSSFLGTGNAGNVSIEANGFLHILNSGIITTNGSSLSNAGNIYIKASELTLDGNNAAFVSKISSESFSGGSGAAGNLFLNINGDLNLFNGAAISNSTNSSGNTGDIQIEAFNIMIDGQGAQNPTNIENITSGAGNGGTTDINALGILTVVNGGTIDVQTFSQGNAGSINIEAQELMIDGQEYTDFSTGILSSAQGTNIGHAGNISVNVKENISILDGGIISASTFNKGQAGTITISSENLLIDNMDSSLVTGINNSAQRDSTGHAGYLSLSINESLTILNGGGVVTSTLSSGNAGQLIVNANTILLDEGSSIESLSTGEGAAGSIDLFANQMTLNNQSKVSIESLWTGLLNPVKSGMTLSVNQLSLNSQSEITSESIYDAF